MNYAGRGVTLDARLQQNPTTWIDGEGLRADGGVQRGRRTRRTHTARRRAKDDRFDLHVDSSPIDLGIVQGFTTAADRTSRAPAGEDRRHRRGRRSAPDRRDHRAERRVHASQPTGVAYTDLDGKIDLQPDSVHIDQIRVLDNQQKPLTITGDLAIHEHGRSAASQIYVNADDFKVIDNKMGNVRINSDLRLTGELNAPRIEGDLGVDDRAGQSRSDPRADGRLGVRHEADRIRDDDGRMRPARRDCAAEPASTRLQIDVHLTVPDDLVVKANDLQGARRADRPRRAEPDARRRSPRQQGRLASSVRLVGSVNTVRGTYDFQGRRFDDPARRHGPVRRRSTSSIRRSTSGPSA